MEKKLYRNEHDKTLAGVASGVADYLHIDVTIVRLLFVLSTIFLAGTGIIVYIVLWIVSPVKNDPTAKFKQFTDYYQANPKGDTAFNSSGAFNNPYENAEQTKWNTPNANQDIKFEAPKANNNDTGRTIVGLILLVLGVYFLLKQWGFVPYWFNIFKLYKLWPLAIVALGVGLIFRNQRKNEWESFKKNMEQDQQPSANPQPTHDVAATAQQEATNSDEESLNNSQ